MENQVLLDAKGSYVPPFDEIHEIGDKFETPDESNPSDAIADPSPNDQLTIKIPGNPILINQTISQYLHSQLSVRFLNDIHQYLWWAARLGLQNRRPLYYLQRDSLQGIKETPEMIRPLHQQVAMLRTITVTEDPCLHLARTTSIFYVKPLPLYLLQWNFFDEHICPEKELYEYATGFLLTYVFLVRNRSDFRIALAEGLIPEMTWTAWSSLATTLAARIRPEDVNQRYRYGELRLRRINLIFFFCCGNMPYIFWSPDDRWYSQFLTVWVLVFAYISVALGALQVILAAEADLALTAKNASYAFGVFTLLSVLLSAGVFMMWSLIAPMTVAIVMAKNMFKIERELRKSV